ncbi:SDR family NAD(P)-dependent oxidoreductase [Glutamicibacter sp.]|uniref:SDR family NAD(P)-dependent oxidoreductase n=1 Tax=Glutamicibacter sp. TaxID=1931995 RepID=UPI0028BE52C0|nr:SDR family NAD(P)-dependent oxidoreductase [Glutamicibacter sp.]
MNRENVMAVTGGASGIGFASASKWVEQGGSAVLLDYDLAAAQRASQDLGPAARALYIDVADAQSVVQAFADLAAKEQRIDALVNSAGIARPAPSSEMTEDEFGSVMDIHVNGTFRVCQAARKLLSASGRGSIVNLASVAAIAGMPGRANYTAAKSAIAGLTRTLAVEWAPEGIRVNAVGPGYVRTPFTDVLIGQGKLRTDGIEARTPLGRFAQPEEIANVIHFLATTDSSYVTGHLLMADGGLTVQGDWY